MKLKTSLKEISWKDILGYYEINKIEELDIFLDQGFHILSCDASYRKQIGTCSIQIRKKGKENTVKDVSFTAIGPVESEIKSILHGIREVQKCKSIKKILLTNDNYCAINLVVGNFNPIKSNIINSVNKVKKELKKLTVPYEVAWVRSKVNRKVDKSAKSYLKKTEEEKEKTIKERIIGIHKSQDRGKDLECNAGGEHVFFVKSSNSDVLYVVDFDKISCTCPSWEKKWGDKEKHTIYSRALPCKHMCKAAEFGELDIFEIFRGQIFRRK
jgi:hypothetical protein